MKGKLYRTCAVTCGAVAGRALKALVRAPQQVPALYHEMRTTRFGFPNRWRESGAIEPVDRNSPVFSRSSDRNLDMLATTGTYKMCPLWIRLPYLPIDEVGLDLPLKGRFTDIDAKKTRTVDQASPPQPLNPAQGYSNSGQ